MSGWRVSRIILGQWAEDDLARAAGELDDQLAQTDGWSSRFGLPMLTGWW
jgi:hypothetical protein